MDHKTIEQEALDHMAIEIQKTIDFEIISSMLKLQGWTELKLSACPSFIEQEIKDWTASHCHGRVHGMDNTWLFEKEKDATMFILRWS